MAEPVAGEPGPPPFLRVVAGAPDEVELAAVTVAIAALLHARQATAREPAERRAPGWRPGGGYRAPGAWSSR